jgi:S1-C subfamily serine protease
MPIPVLCACGTRFKVADSAAGKDKACPICQSLVHVPTPADAHALGPPATPAHLSQTGIATNVMESPTAPLVGNRPTLVSAAHHPTIKWLAVVAGLAGTSALGMGVLCLWLALRSSPVARSDGSAPLLATTAPDLDSRDPTLEPLPDDPLAADTAAAEPRMRLSTEEIVGRCEASVALVRGRAGSGTGFVVLPGIVVTNAHVVAHELARDLKVHFPSAQGALRGPRSAEVLYFNLERDLAFLKLDGASPEPLEIAGDHRFRRGQDVTIIGSPGLGNGQVLENAVTRGVLSTRYKLQDKEFYQLGAAINPGNSGGPVIDDEGRVIGVAALKTTKVEALAFCVPAADLAKAVDLVANLTPDQIKEARERHYAAASVHSDEERAAILTRWGAERVLILIESGRLVAETDPKVVALRPFTTQVTSTYAVSRGILVRDADIFFGDFHKRNLNVSAQEFLEGVVVIADEVRKAKANRPSLTEAGTYYTSARIRLGTQAATLTAMRDAIRKSAQDAFAKGALARGSGYSAREMAMFRQARERAVEQQKRAVRQNELRREKQALAAKARPEILLKQGLALESTNPTAALEYYHRVIDEYPESPEAKKAAERLGALEGRNRAQDATNGAIGAR